MYTPNRIKSYGGLGEANYYNPPAWYQSTDPSQIPIQVMPYDWRGGGGGGSYNPYGPWPGYSIGQRIMTMEDVQRAQREKQKFLERRADISESPEHKYLSPEGRLNPGIKKLIKVVEAQERQKKKKKVTDVIGNMQKRIFTTVLIGAVLSALLR